MMHQSKSVDCAGSISLACSILKLSLQEAKALLQYRIFSEISYYDNGIRDICLNIELDSAYLTCVFDKEMICGGVIIHLEKWSDILDYINYCKKRYIYNYISRSWFIEDFTTIQINTEEEYCLHLCNHSRSTKQ